MSEEEKRELPAGWVWTTLGEIAQVNPGKSRVRDLGDDTEVTFVPMSAVDEKAGTIAEPQTRLLGDVRKGYTCFGDGDVLFAKITPCMENGKAAIAHDLRNQIGFGSTEFHVLKPHTGVLAEWIYHYVRRSEYRNAAKACFAGTAGQLRVPSSFVANSPIPLAPINEQRRIVAKIEELLTRLDAGVAALKRAQAKLKRYKASVLKAACEGRLVPTEAELARSEGRSYERAEVLLQDIAEERKQHYLTQELKEKRTIVGILVNQASVTTRPVQLLSAWLLEMVVNGFDLTHSLLIRQIIELFFDKFDGIMSFDDQVNAMVDWLDETMVTLSTNELGSMVIERHATAWHTYVDGELKLIRRGITPRRLTISLGADSTAFDVLTDSFIRKKIEEKGAAGVRESQLIEPAIEKWRAENERTRKPDIAALSQLPSGWAYATVDQLGMTIGGVTKGRHFRDQSTVSVPYLRVANVQRMQLDLREIKNIEMLAYEIDRYRLYDGDLVLTEGGDADKLGRSAIWHNEISNCVHQNHIFRLRLYLKTLPIEWLMYYTNSELGRKYFSEASKQTTNLASINLTQLKSCPVPVPPISEVKRIVLEIENRLSIIDEAEMTININLARAERLRQSILKRAFSGKLIPQDPNDEPASVLLQKIRETQVHNPAPSKPRSVKKNVAAIAISPR